MLFVSIRQRKNRDVAVSTDLSTMSQRLKVQENNLRQAWIPVRRVSKVFKNAVKVECINIVGPVVRDSLLAVYPVWKLILQNCENSLGL